MKNNIILLSVATLSLLSGCGIYKSYQPETSVPDNLFREEAPVTDTTSIGNLDWRELFTDPQLQALIEKGLENNTDLRTAHLRVQEAEAALMTSRLAYLPALNLTPQGTISSFDSRQKLSAGGLSELGNRYIRETDKRQKKCAGSSRTNQIIQTGRPDTANSHYSQLLLHFIIARQTTCHQ